MSNEDLTKAEEPSSDFWGQVKADLAVPADNWILDLPNGKKCEIKNIADGNALRRLTKHAGVMAQAIVKGAVPEVQGLPQFEEDIARACFLCSHLIAFPPMSLRQALEIATQCGPAIMQISNEIMLHGEEKAMAIEAEKIDASKNALAATVTGEQFLPSPATPTINTPTT